MPHMPIKLWWLSIASERQGSYRACKVLPRRQVSSIADKEKVCKFSRKGEENSEEKQEQEQEKKTKDLQV